MEWLLNKLQFIKQLVEYAATIAQRAVRLLKAAFQPSESLRFFLMTFSSSIQGLKHGDA